MSYQAIARKWRPVTFEDIAGQTHVTQTLRNALRLKRIHHAFLFTGARGVGKTTAARTFARCLNCVNGPTPEPCGVCPSCLEVPQGLSPDVTEIDGASNNSVDDVRELRDAVRYLPSRDRYRIYIIDEVHMLSIGAFNALLKTLEEPPAHVVFIFATTESQKIPDTILSRVQRFDFKRIPEGVVVTRLSTICAAEGVVIPEQGLRLIARAGEGSMRDAQSLLDQVIAFGGDDITLESVARTLGLVDRELLYGFLEGLLRGEPEGCLDVIAQVYDYGYELSQFTAEILELLRNAALVVLSPSSRRHLDVAEEEQTRLGKICAGVDVETFSRYFQAMLSLHDEVSRASRPRLVLEMGVARLAIVRPLQPVDHLVSRLEELERRLRATGGGTSARGGPPRPFRPEEGDASRPPTSPPPLASAPTRPVEPERAPSRPQRPPPPPPPSPAAAAVEAAPPPPPPPLPEAASDDERFRALIKHVKSFGRAWDTFAENIVLLGREGVALVIGVGTAFRERVATKLEASELKAAVAVLFPGLARVELRDRGESEGRSLKEHRDERRRTHLEDLRAQVDKDPMIQRVRDLLGAEIVQVHSLSTLEDE
ncbi:MAG: DNA polymerase III subunit gamma/tau [Deltaproteobacteria bacterium]|nr:DNA polymerase III subunit gamma/tau [Deltaproteobacteria bacterium]MBK9643943.1 DNA polymerase III subunit gamma/tau [Deltaproteobacteria bacterium]